jgi:2-aminoadipate transaminase
MRTYDPLLKHEGLRFSGEMLRTFTSDVFIRCGVPEGLIASLSVVKEASDIDTSTFVQRTVAAYADQGGLLDHIAILRNEYKLRRDTMIKALSRHLPIQARWQIPTSGVFIWVELPEHLNGSDLLRISMSRERVAFVPGAAFCSLQNHHGANCIRLNFSHSTPELINKGIRRLGCAIKALEDDRRL